MIEAVIKFFGIFCLVLLLLDFLFGNLWATAIKQILKKLSEMMLTGAVMDLYHHQIGTLLNIADNRIGRFIPGVRFLFMAFSLLVVMQLLGTLVQVIEENITVSPTSFLRNLFVFSSASTLSMSFCYTVTYMVLYLVHTGEGPFWLLRYLYLVILEIFVSYVLAPFAFASLFIFGGCPECNLPDVSRIEDSIRIFAILLADWPYSVIQVGSGVYI